MRRARVRGAEVGLEGVVADRHAEVAERLERAAAQLVLRLGAEVLARVLAERPRGAVEVRQEGLLRRERGRADRRGGHLAQRGLGVLEQDEQLGREVVEDRHDVLLLHALAERLEHVARDAHHALGARVHQREHDRQHLAVVREDLGLAVLGELAVREAHALARRRVAVLGRAREHREHLRQLLADPVLRALDDDAEADRRRVPRLRRARLEVRADELEGRREEVLHRHLERELVERALHRLLHARPVPVLVVVVVVAARAVLEPLQRRALEERARDVGLRRGDHVDERLDERRHEPLAHEQLGLALGCARARKAEEGVGGESRRAFARARASLSRAFVPHRASR